MRKGREEAGLGTGSKGTLKKLFKTAVNAATNKYGGSTGGSAWLDAYMKGAGGAPQDLSAFLGADQGPAPSTGMMYGGNTYASPNLPNASDYLANFTAAAAQNFNPSTLYPQPSAPQYSQPSAPPQHSYPSTSQYSQPSTSQHFSPSQAPSSSHQNGRMGKYKAFICHEGSIKPGILSVLLTELRRQGLESQVFYDLTTDRGGSSGDTLANRLTTALRNTDVLVAFFTKEFLQSRWPQWEVKTFLSMMDEGSNNKKLLPVFYGVSARECKAISKGTADPDLMRSIGSNVEELKRILGRATEYIGIDARRENRHMSDDEVIQDVFKNVFGAGFIPTNHAIAPSQRAGARERSDVGRELYDFALKSVKQGPILSSFFGENTEVPILRAAAYLGCVEAMMEVGELYRKGVNGLAMSDVKALEMYVEAFSKGHADAGARLGDACLFGRGLPKDDARAIEYYQRAADLGSPLAMRRFGLCLELGYGVEPNAKLAVHWYSKAADHGDKAGMCLLGACVESGNGCAKDGRRAKQLFERAGVDAIVSLADEFDMENLDEVRTVQWCERAARSGHRFGLCLLAACYETGKGVPQDLRTAKELYRKGGGMTTCIELSAAYQKMDNPEKARQWQERAMKNYY